jgi:sphingomyelin phosphodiesterase acid-like 3
LQRKFPKTKIFITPGNNDNDCENYSIEANGAFLHDIEWVARDLAGGNEDFTKSWTALGSFNVPHSTVKGTRLLSLNSIFWSQKYIALSSRQGCTPVPTTADLMRWLEQQLAAAAEAHERVWLMFHIPPGIDGYATAMNREKPEAANRSANVDRCAQSIVPMWAPQWTSSSMRCSESIIRL